jgi:hypothetical protein
MLSKQKRLAVLSARYCWLLAIHHHHMQLVPREQDYRYRENFELDNSLHYDRYQRIIAALDRARAALRFATRIN